MVCDMLVTMDGDVSAYQFYPAVMWSHARFTYTEVAAILANTRPEASRRQDRVPDLINLHDVYRALLTSRNRRGAVDFETTETQIVCDDSGRIEKIIPRTRNDAHKLIEEAMLAVMCAVQISFCRANSRVCTACTKAQPPKKGRFCQTPEGDRCGPEHQRRPTPGEFQAIANATKDRPDAQQIHSMLLRSMQQAIFTPINSGHFGLAFEAYTPQSDPALPGLAGASCHQSDSGENRSTSCPCCQRRSQLSRRLEKRACLACSGTRAKPKKVSADNLAWQAAGLHCSANERRADEASRDVEAAQMQVHARAPRRRIRRRGDFRHQFWYLCNAGCDVC